MTHTFDASIKAFEPHSQVEPTSVYGLAQEEHSVMAGPEHCEQAALQDGQPEPDE